LHRVGWARLGSLLVLLCAAMPRAEAANLGPPGEVETGLSELGEEKPGEPVFSPGELLGAFRKERQELKDIGIVFSLHERSEVWGNVAGGAHLGTSYNGLTVAKLDINFETLAGWTGGEFYTSAFDIHGHGPSRSFVGNQQLVSNIEATPSIKLYDLWFDQSLFGKTLSIRFGQEGANDEMMATAYGGLFINSSFGYPGMPASVLPSGGPNYPIASPFARALYNVNEHFTIVGAAYTDDPAPLGPGDPQIRDRNGTAFRLNDHTLGFGELWYSPTPHAPDMLPTTYKIGAWYATDQFADRRFDNTGGLLANPAGTGIPANHTGDWAIYGIIDQKIWQQPGSKDLGIGLFLQVMGGPSDRNLANFFIEGGMNWVGPFAQRPLDSFGLAFSYLGISPAEQAFGRDLVTFGRATTSYASNETVLEATYQAPVTNWLILQPDLQYVINPNAGIPNNFGNTPLPNAVVIGMRFTIRL
jgi:porin